MDDDEFPLGEFMKLWEEAQKEVMMGLGPTVCKNCMVYTAYKPHPTIQGRQGIHFCPICLSEDGKDQIYLWTLPDDEQEAVYDNTEFLRFIQGVPSTRKQT